MWIPSRTLINWAVGKMNGNDTIGTHNLANSWLGLLKAPCAYTPDGDATIATSVEADYTGYARQQITAWTSVFIAQIGFTLAADGAKLFQPSGTTVQNTIYGQILMGSDSVTLLAVELFDAPIPLATVASGVLTTPIIGQYMGPRGFGSSIVAAA